MQSTTNNKSRRDTRLSFNRKIVPQNNIFRSARNPKQPDTCKCLGPEILERAHTGVRTESSQVGTVLLIYI